VAQSSADFPSASFASAILYGHEKGANALWAAQADDSSLYKEVTSADVPKRPRCLSGVNYFLG
jgi:hypothetical protein